MKNEPSSPPRGAPSGSALDALGRMFEAHSERVYRAAHRITGNPMDAEDVMQSVFLRLARHSGAPLEGDAAVGYFYRSAVNAALDVVRSRQRAGWAPLEEADRTPALAAEALGSSYRSSDGEFEPERERRLKQLRKALRQAISRLSPRSAEIFSLRYFEGLTNQQIAEMTGQSAGLIAVLLHRTRARLKKELSGYDSFVGELS
ncbi:MAG: sigma-70 family RNA polymerase sigma factor [Thermoanaerobaculia bacterium]